MRRSTSFLAVLMFSGVGTFLLANLSSAQAGGGNCQAKLVGKAYNCTLEQPTMPPQAACFEFVTGGLSANFDLVIAPGGVDLGCACDATGSFKSPSYDGSSSPFECVTETGTQLNGKIKSNKLGGQATNTQGMSAVYTCTETATCP